MNAYRFKKPLSAGTAMSPQIRLAALAALTLLLTACPTTMPSRQGQSSHTHNHTPAPEGQRPPEGDGGAAPGKGQDHRREWGAGGGPPDRSSEQRCAQQWLFSHPEGL